MSVDSVEYQVAREEAETVFHDEWAASVNPADITVSDYFESPACPENARVIDLIGNIEGKRLLELGCGCGEASVYFALRGAAVTAVDISQGMLNTARNLAELHGVKIETICSSATTLESVPDSAFDIVYAANMLHHVDIPKTMRLVYKKLRPGGVAYFIDPLAYNPVITAYRLLATKYRTKDEQPLNYTDFREAKLVFGNVKIEFFWIAALAIFLKFFFIDRLHPNKQRYWKKIVVDVKRYHTFLVFAHAVDSILCRTPILRWLSWNMLMCCRKSG